MRTPTEKLIIISIACFLSAFVSQPVLAQKSKTIYHKDWIDLNKNGKKDIYETPTAPIEARIADLLSQMTVEEKTCQLATLYGYKRVAKDELPIPAWKQELWKDGIANIDEHLNGLVKTQYSYPFSKHAEAINTVQRWFIEETRLGIPVDFSNEGIHGLNHDRATPLPAPIAIGSTWNAALVRQAGEIVGREAKALGYTNVYAPILDLARDPRWGRVLECYGEEPFHVTTLGKEMVAGIQSQGVAATLKHFAVYSVPKGGRDGHARTDPHVAPREMHQLHLYPYRKIIREVHPMGVMSSYNDWDGIPVSGSYYFLTELLREKYGFDGYVVSDSEAVEFVYSKHRVAQDMKGAVKQVVEAGLNVKTNFTQPSDFVLPLRELVAEGSVSMQTLDRNVADVLRVKFRLGLFDSPYVTDTKAADKIVASSDTKEFEKQMGRESLVLLKNEANLLPLQLSNLRNILVTGPLATDTTAYVSRYGPQNLQVTHVLQGVRDYVGQAATVHYAKGCEVVDATWPESEKDKKTMEKFYYVNTHLDHVGRVARKEGLNLILEKIQKINPDNFPLILTGDFNMEHTDSSIQKLNEKMIDARTSAKKTDSFGTFNGWGTRSSIIDYIYYKGFKMCTEYVTIREKYAGKTFISDHYPIKGVLKF